MKISSNRRTKALQSVRPSRPCNQSLQRMKEWKGEGRAGVPAALVWFDADSRAAGLAAFWQLDALVGDRREAGTGSLSNKSGPYQEVAHVPIQTPKAGEGRSLFTVAETTTFFFRNIYRWFRVNGLL